MTESESQQPAARKPLYKRLLPLAVLVAIIAAVYLSGATDYLSYEALRANLDAIQGFVESRTVLALLLLIAVYAVGTAASVPAMSVVTVAAGVVYGLWLGFLGTLIGATLGATVIFVVVRTSLGDALRRRVRPWLGRFEDGFRRDAFNYLLAMRLVPVFPFWVLNIAPALLGMRLRDYVAATMLGIVPGTFVYVWVGRGAAETIRLGGRVSPAEFLFSPHILGPLLGLAVLAVLPIAVRKWRARRGVTPDAGPGPGPGSSGN